MRERGKIRAAPPSDKVKAHWVTTLDDLESFYKDYALPAGPVKLSVCETIVDCKKFVSSHLIIARANMANRTFAPYVARLQKLKEILQQQNSIAA